MKYFSFELFRMKKIILPLGLTTVELQLLFLFFFALVGRFDHSDSSNMLTNYNAVLGLATTGTMCVLAVYGTVLASQVLVRNYVGMNRSKTFLLPVSRKELFYTRLLALSSIIATAMIVGLLVANIVFDTLGLAVHLIARQPITGTPGLGVSIIVGTGLTLSVVLLSSFIGIKMNSTVKAIIASIVFVVFLSNLAAITLMSYTFVALLIIVILAVIVISLGLNMGNSIDKNEVL